jgi:hypothetical protein
MTMCDGQVSRTHDGCPTFNGALDEVASVEHGILGAAEGPPAAVNPDHHGHRPMHASRTDDVEGEAIFALRRDGKARYSERLVARGSVGGGVAYVGPGCVEWGWTREAL